MSVSGLPQTYPVAYSPINQPQQDRGSDPLQIIENNASPDKEDKASISPGGRLLGNMPSILGEKAGADGVITLDEMREFFREKAADFQSEVRNRLNAMGVDATQTLDLTTDSQGHVRVANDHPDKEKIEAMFAENPELAGDFRQISATGSLIKVCEAHIEFAADYAKDPEAAVAKHWHLFSGLKEEYVLRLGEADPAMVKKA